ncbi:MAG: hypothetical protein CMJ10_00865 [Pelagibacterales bacterium]|jgi:hypothetical protein|nr:hypothetical protein [Pelagibacterales bacterium]MCH2678939.1 hypothetical protein [Alphaproteobacteria bacterium]|tara:strand:- start:230 stop:592 length:363 start_codon:yes stop_codon:yes gene_type:complete
MKNKTVHIISDSFSLKINKEIANFNIINILLNENKSLSDVIIEVSKNTDLIVLVNLYNISDPEIIKNIKNIDCNFIYCSEENFEKINKVNEIATVTPHVIQGFKSDTDNILYETIKKLIN